MLRTERGKALQKWLTDPNSDLHVPALCDVELVSALRGLELREQIDAPRAEKALKDYLDLPLIHHPHTALVPLIFSARRNFSAYDATYVALAEALGAHLLSADRALLRAVRTHTGLTTFPDR